MFVGMNLFGSYELAVLIKIVLAALAGGIIGLEREKHGRPAGLRTHLLVAVGSCLMMVISEAFFLRYGGLNGTTLAVRVDPGRVAAQIVSGIGFLGAGVIIKEGFSIRGLTTAASLWLVAGLGMAYGMGLFGPGTIATVVALFSLIFLKRLEPILNKDRYLHLTVTASLDSNIYPQLEQLIEERRLHISDLAATTDLENGKAEYHFIITQQQRRIGRDLTDEIVRLPGVQKIQFK